MRGDPGFPTARPKVRQRVRLCIKESRMRFVDAAKPYRKSGADGAPGLISPVVRCPLQEPLKSRSAAFIVADTDGFVDLRDEYLSVANLACSRRGDDGLHGLLQ